MPENYKKLARIINKIFLSIRKTSLIKKILQRKIIEFMYRHASTELNNKYALSYINIWRYKCIHNVFIEKEQKQIWTVFIG